ncbi:MAG: hypothetical protein MO853_05655 [Candidatus Protistobacter heckmanni]|nr:hypothetical protein [Candidatus Protistobacter heckmanni]
MRTHASASLPAILAALTALAATLPAFAAPCTIGPRSRSPSRKAVLRTPANAGVAGLMLQPLRDRLSDEYKTLRHYKRLLAHCGVTTD